ncbi:MAG TPA: FhaA domain-containing protein [Anaerolineales bacterium]|jgi:hypothetical protein|nr:FhaA domain-containing protein [Anaerolineales bacterium]
MSTLKEKLAKWEDRLQSLVEGSAARSFTFFGDAAGLADNLIAAMKAGVQLGPLGESLAPDLYTLVVHPDYVPVLKEDPGLLPSLAADLQQAGAAAGLRFQATPQVKVSADPQVLPRQLRVLAKISQPNLDETSALPLGAGEASGGLPENAFLIVDGNQVFPLTQPVVTIGRLPDSHLVIEDLRVSRVHAQLRAINGRFVIFDLDSTGGTFVNGTLQPTCTLSPGDVISLAGVSLVFGQDPTGSTGGFPGETEPYSPHHPRL